MCYVGVVHASHVLFMPRTSGSHIVNTPHGPKTKNATENLKNLVT